MAIVKRKWKTIGIPESLHKRVKNLHWKVGIPSIAEFCRSAILNKVELEEPLVEEVVEEVNRGGQTLN